jgi:hypothetical protein
MTDQMSPAEASANSANILKFIIQLLENIPTPILIHNDVVTSIHFLKDLQSKCELDVIRAPIEHDTASAAFPVEGPQGEAPPVVDPVFVEATAEAKPLPPRLAHFENARKLAREARKEMSKEEVLKAKEAAGNKFEAMFAPKVNETGLPGQGLTQLAAFEEARKVARERREAQRLEREAKKGEKK